MLRKIALAFALLSVCAFLAQAADSGVTGKWNFVLDTEGGERQAPAEFGLDGEKVTGTFGPAEVKGTFAENKLELKFPFESEEVGKGTLVFKGKIENGALTGDWSFETEAQTYTGSFKATRPQ
jgi:hypothetical protein